MNFEEGKDYEQPPVKTHPARLIGIYDIGKQPGNNYEGEQTDPKFQVIFTWELLGKDKQSDGSNFTISEFLTVSLHKKGTMPKRLTALGAPIKSKSQDWYELPKDYQLSNLLGEAAMVEVALKDNGKSKIASVMSLIDGMTVAENSYPLGFLDLDSDDWTDQFGKAPEWIKRMCEKSIGWADRL